MNKEAQKRVAKERILYLFEEAQNRPAYAKRYVVLARKLSSRYKVRMPDIWRARYCKACNAFLVPSRNARIRMKKGKVVTTCLDCSSIRRIPTR